MNKYYNITITLDNGAYAYYTEVDYYKVEQPWVILSTQNQTVFYNSNEVISIHIVEDTQS